MKNSGTTSLFITLEGGEGSGKSTQAKKLYQRLRRSSVSAILVYEPGCTPLGDKLAKLLKRRDFIDAPQSVQFRVQFRLFDIDISPISQLMLFNASRAQLVNDVIRPALKEGKTVICDRYTDSTIAYQGYGGKVDMKHIAVVNAIATGGLIPDLTILLDIPVEEGLARKDGEEHDRFEREEIMFLKRVRQGYLDIAASEPERFLIVDARMSQRTISKIIWKRVSDLLNIQST